MCTAVEDLKNDYIFPPRYIHTLCRGSIASLIFCWAVRPVLTALFVVLCCGGCKRSLGSCVLLLENVVEFVPRSFVHSSSSKKCCSTWLPIQLFCFECQSVPFPSQSQITHDLPLLFPVPALSRSAFLLGASSSWHSMNP